MTPDGVPDGPLLVDTDVVSYWTVQSQRGEAFTELVAGHELAVSFATYGELLANGYRNRWGDRRMQMLQTRLRGLRDFEVIAAELTDLVLVHPSL